MKTLRNYSVDKNNEQLSILHESKNKWLLGKATQRIRVTKTWAIKL